MLSSKTKLRQACVIAINDPDNEYGLFLDRVEGGLYAALFWCAENQTFVLAQIDNRFAKEYVIHISKLKKI